MLEVAIIYTMIYGYATHKMWTLAKRAIAQIHVASLKSLDKFMEENKSPTDSATDLKVFHKKTVVKLNKAFQRLDKVALRSCVINGIYLCPLVMIFCLVDEDSFADTFVSEYKSTVLSNVISTLDLLGMEDHDVREVIADTLRFVEDGESDE